MAVSKKMPEIDLADAEKVWQSKALQKKIQNLYKQVAADLAKEAEKLPKEGTISEKMKKGYLDKYVKNLNKEIDKLESEVGNEIKSGMKKTAESVVGATNDFMAKVGLNIEGAFDKVPSDVVASLLSGEVYEGNWSFSKAIWKSGEKTKDDIYKIVAEGLAKQKPTYDIAKDLEKYVDPTAKKDWDWAKVYPGTNKQVDYSAQRLARTLLQHAYQQAYRQAIKYNPFVTGVIWHSVFAAGRTCELCKERDGTRYDKGKEPLDHPMGLCYLEPEIPKSLDEIADELADWANGGSNPKLDEFYKQAYKGTIDKQKIQKPLPKKRAYKALTKSQYQKWASEQNGFKVDSKFGKSGKIWQTDFGKYYMGNADLTKNMNKGALTKADKDSIAIIDKMINFELPQDSTLYRWVDEDFIKAVFGTTDPEDLAKTTGTTFTTDQYLSTSASYHYGFGDRPMMLQIQLKEGTKVWVSPNISEYEVLLGKNKKWEIVSVTDTKDSYYTVPDFDSPNKKKAYKGIVVTIKESEQ